VFDLLHQNTEAFKEAVSKLTASQLGSSVDFYNEDLKLTVYKFSILGVNETRGDDSSTEGRIEFESIKAELYKLYRGNWNFRILDLGFINSGEKQTDTYFFVKEIVHQLLLNDSMPIILGGSQDLVYPIYRAYDKIKYMLNLVNIDYKFDLGESSKAISNSSYLSHMVVDKPYNLFNYSNVGYQTYLNAQEEIELLDKMFFETYRLGEVTHDLKAIEPVFRDADLVSLDIRSVESLSLGEFGLEPNGFSSREICALSRYAGFSDKVTSFGIFELQYAHSLISRKLIAQIIWYFFEGVAYRLNEVVDISNPEFLKYQVPVDNDTLIFYKSKLSGRWWIEIPSDISKTNNKLKQHTLLPCNEQNYLKACDQELPERWLLAKQKNEF
jgi:arginase family enzyme